jgi:serine phosphatase RsbU (regulator of sigma subunit)
LPEARSLLLYTDGLFEGSVRPNALERFGIDRLAERFGRAAPGPISVEALDKVLAELQQTNGKPLPDDVAALLISKREADEHGSRFYRTAQPAAV